MAHADEPKVSGVDRSRRVKYIRSIDQVTNIPESEREKLKKVSERYVFRANDYYLGLINWNDPNDPIKQLIIPRQEELNDWGQLDASKESQVTVARGVQHKYPHTVLLLCNEVCGAYCRFCFRKRLFMDDNDEVVNDVGPGLEYIRRHPEIKWLRTPQQRTDAVALQARLLQRLWPLLDVGGILLYATCSVLRDENSRQIECFAAGQPDAQLITIDASWGRPVDPGRQILPGEGDMDGFYYARLRKT